MGLVNEKELGESIAANLEPKIVVAQARLESYMDSLIDRLATRYSAHIKVPLGDRTVTITVDLVPKP